MKKLLSFFIIPLLFVVFAGCEPVDVEDLPEEEQEMLETDPESGQEL